jgi:hypothetical protein
MLGAMVRAALFVIDLAVAVTAIGGGIALGAGLERSRFSTDLLDGTPFSSFLVPGLLLAVLVGGTAAVAAAGVVEARAAGGAASVLAGALLAAFIAAEVLLLRDGPGWDRTEGLYFAAGLVMAALGAATWAAGGGP